MTSACAGMRNASLERFGGRSECWVVDTRRGPCACATDGGVKERGPGPACQPMTSVRLCVLLVGAGESRRWARPGNGERGRPGAHRCESKRGMLWAVDNASLD